MAASFFSVFYSAIVFAQVVPDAGTMIENLAKALPNLMRLVTALAYVMGFFFVVKGIMELKHHGEARSMMSREHSLARPLIYIGVGAALIYLPSSVQTGLSTFWTDPNPYAYVTQATDPWSELMNACFMIFQLLGVIAFIRGLIILTRVGGHQGQPGTLGRAVTHIIGGILLINMYQFIQVVTNTLALGQN